MKNDIYFSNVPDFGNLYLEEILFEDECPILFTLCNENSSARFIAVCCDFRKEQRWIISTVDISSIIDLLKDKITIRDIFTIPKSSYVIGVWKHGYDNVIYTLCNFNQIPKEDLPSADVYFEAENGEFDEYITFLESLSYGNITVDKIKNIIYRANTNNLNYIIKNDNFLENINLNSIVPCNEQKAHYIHLPKKEKNDESYNDNIKCIAA